jgi:hypothetical protein
MAHALGAFQIKEGADMKDRDHTDDVGRNAPFLLAAQSLSGLRRCIIEKTGDFRARDETMNCLTAIPQGSPRSVTVAQTAWTLARHLQSAEPDERFDLVGTAGYKTLESF